MVTQNIHADVVPVERSRISWGAIFAATVVSLAVWLLLYAFGLAVGFTALDPTDAGSLRATGIGTGVWSVIAPLIALFIGGIVASRESAVTNRLDGAIHGVVMWALTALLGVILLGTLITSVVGGAARFVGGTANVAAEAVSGVGGGDGGGQAALQALGLDANALLAPINERLDAEGRPPVSAAGLQATLQSVVNEAVRTGELDRADVVSAISSNTALSRQDAEAVAAQVEAQWQSQSQQLQQQLSGAAAQAADVTAGTLWALAAALLLSLVTAVLGSLVGLKHRRGYVDRAAPTTHGEFAPAH